MRLNRVNYEKEEDEKDDNDEEKEEEEVEDEEKGETNEQKEEEENEGEEEEDGNEENEYEDHQGKMIGNSKNEKVRSKKIKIKMPNIKDISKLKKNKPLLKIIIWIICILVSFIILLKIILAIARKVRKKKIQSVANNDEMKLLNNLDANKLNKVKDYLVEQYNSNGEINLNKFQEDTINQKEYKPPDSGLTHIHISTGFSLNCTCEIIIHLSSIISHLSSSSFLHIHLMSSDNFTLEAFTSLMNMVHKINNNTEIIVYNTQQALKDFKIREDKLSLFTQEYARLYALKAIKGAQKLVMLNIYNIMAEKDFNELFNLDINDIYCRGVTEVPNLKYKIDWIDNYLYDKSHYINGDVLLINLELCQKEDMYNKAVELNNNHFYHSVEDPVQDILNVILKKKIEFFNPKYNKNNFYENAEDKNDESKWYPWAAEAMKYSEKNNHFYSKSDLLTADGDPVIVNYYWDKQLGKKPKRYEDQKEAMVKLNGLTN